MKTSSILLLLALIISLSLQTKAFAQEQEINTKEALDINAQTIFDNSDLPGLTIIVVNDEGVLHQKSFGFADVATKKAFNNQTTQNIGSISKTLISIAIMKAVEDGKVNLDEDINTYLPFKVNHPKFSNTPITLRHLATHTAGIIDDKVYSKSYYFPNASEIDLATLPNSFLKDYSDFRENVKMDESEFLTHMLTQNGKWYSKKNFSKQKPGEKYIYSNVGATLAAFVVEAAVGIPYEAYTKQIIFNPLGMNESGWTNSDVISENLATRYLENGTPVPDYELITKADGAVLTNASNFSAYLIEMIKGFHGNGTLLKGESYQELFKIQHQEEEEAIGLFWEIDPNGKKITHNGGDPGIIAVSQFNPVTKIGCFVMMNTDITKKNAPTLLGIWRSYVDYNWTKIE